MTSVHLVISDLFLPNDIAAETCAGLRLTALEKILARGRDEAARKAGLETLLCELFGVPCKSGAPIGPISARFDGLGEGCWMRADPVHLRLQRDQLIMLPGVEASAAEAAQLCALLNGHFTGQRLEFFAPHPQRWYVRLNRLPDIENVPLSQAIGRNVRALLPSGAEALRWHQLSNEIQMLLFSHAVNQAREERGELPINSLWFWGEGCSSALTLRSVFANVSSDEGLAEMFAATAGVPFSGWLGHWREEGATGAQLLVWTGLRSALQRGDLDAWRAALQEFETGYAQPLWQALRTGRITQLQMDVISGTNLQRLSLRRADAWAFWRRPRALSACSVV